MRLVVFSTILIGISLLQTVTDVRAQGIREYQRRFIGDIGYAAVSRDGTPIVVMNPSACRRLGPELCSFFHAHERAHHQLGHFSRNISVQQKEAEADRYAASVVSPAARAAAQRFFASGRGAGPLHGTSQQRLARVSGAATTIVPGSTAFAGSTTRGAVGQRLTATSSRRLVWRPLRRWRR